MSSFKNASPRCQAVRIGSAAVVLTLVITTPGLAYDDHGRKYRVPATYRWQQEWMDARHHAFSAWQERQASYYGKPAISVCVTYYAAPYYACEGNFVDWYWGNVGRRSGFLTDPTKEAAIAITM